jgi:ABC-type lipoprotein release transport system permease subunit
MGRNLMTSDSFTDGQAVNFALPWGEIAFIIATAYVFSLVMTWFPSRGAARVPVAEALRYE